jgi:hypothetical protein
MAQYSTVYLYMHIYHHSSSSQQPSHALALTYFTCCYVLYVTLPGCYHERHCPEGECTSYLNTSNKLHCAHYDLPLLRIIALRASSRADASIR